MLHRAVIIVMDSCGAGEAPDAAEYGDSGADTLGKTSRVVGGFDLPHFQQAGLGNLHRAIEGLPPAANPTMAYGRMAEASAGKDSTAGHWEIAGVVTSEASATFPDGFPDDLVAGIEEESGYEFIGNYPASGTVIIEELGGEHLETGRPILYTSADSVFQIAAHKDVIPLAELYRLCEISRLHCNGHRIGRVIARPFEGEQGSFYRTYERHDYAMPPSAPTLLDVASGAGLPVHGIGKIEDLFAGQGLTSSVHTEGDGDGLERTLEALGDIDKGIIFTNLVDLDMRYGHRENPEGYYGGLKIIDGYLPRLVDAIGDRDLLILTADHGNDPTDGSTDHTREYVPLLVAASAAAGVDLGDRTQYCDVAATIAQGLGLPATNAGTSFLGLIT